MKQIAEILDNENLIYAVLSNKRNAVTKYGKITVAPFVKDDTVMYQFESFDGKKAFHENVSDCKQKLFENLPLYKSLALFTDKYDYTILIGKKGNLNIKKNPPTKKLAVKSHNKEKNYYFKDGTPYRFLVSLGIMTEDGKVKPTKYNKFVQINKYIEIIGSSIDRLKLKDTVHIVDFGCGKAYLTFALYHYFVNEKKLNVKVTGVDLKEDVIKTCTDLSRNLGFDGLKFVNGDIADFTSEDVDIAVSLHACDTATDIALIKAVGWGAKLIVAVPCCHHEIFDSVRNDTLNPILQYGVLKDKFASLLTDAMRGLALQTVGYSVNISEFTPIENTPKNVLIKAVKTGAANKNAEKSYNELKRAFNVCPYIDRMI